jgi:DNA-binding LytR/AlgR family response regulator
MISGWKSPSLNQPKMKALIIEDEELAARNLKQVLTETGTVQVIATLESIVDTIEWFSTHPSPDLLFMDIHLADGSAFEIFDRIKIQCPVIFTTAYDEFALKAFKVNSIDYLLKPVDLNAVQRALNKLQELTVSNHFHADMQNLLASFKKTATYKSHFLVPVKGDKLMPVQAGEIACIYIDASIVKALTFDERSLRFEYTLDELSDLLDPADFFRANRQYIINRNAIKDIDLWFNNRLSVNLKVAVPEKILISKARIPEFREWFSGK